MEHAFQFAALCSSAFLFITLYRLGYLETLRPSSLFFAFFFLQYGPIFLVDARHTYNDEFISTFGISDFGPKIVEYTYAALALSYTCIAIGLITTEAIIERLQRSLGGGGTPVQLNDHTRQTFDRLYRYLVIAAVVASVAFLSIGIVREKLLFFYSLITGHISAIDYSTFRRVTLTNDPNSGSVIRLRMNFSMPLMALVSATGFYLRRPIVEIVLVVATFSVIAIFDLTKQGTLIAALIVVVCAYLVRNHGALPKIRTLVLPLAFMTVAGISLLFGLYTIQYLGAKHVDASVIWQTLMYRVTRINADCLNLYFVFFQHPLFEKGVSTSTTLASLFNKQSLDVPSYIPQLYGAITSFPDVFFGGMWIDFGWFGIVASSLAVGAICSIADFIGRNLTVVPVKAAYIACMMFALNYFGQIQFFTTISTYGIASTMVVFSVLDYFLWTRVVGSGAPRASASETAINVAV